MNSFKGDGVAIALLIGSDERSIVGWVYRWEAGTLKVLWNVDGPQRVSRTEPELSREELKEIGFEGLQKI